MPYWLRSSSHEPGIWDLALPLNPLWNFQFVHMRGGAGSVPKMWVSGLEILPYEHFIPVTGIKAGWILAIFHIISILFNCSDTALGVSEAVIGMKVKFFCVSPCLLCFSYLVPDLVPRIFCLFSSGKLGWNFSYEPKVKFLPVTVPARSTGLMWRGS